MKVLGYAAEGNQCCSSADLSWEAHPGRSGGPIVTTRVTGSDQGDWRLSVSSTATKAGLVTAGLELEKGAVGHRLQADPSFYGGHEGHSSLGPLERTWPAISLISVQ